MGMTVSNLVLNYHTGPRVIEYNVIDILQQQEETHASAEE